MLIDGFGRKLTYLRLAITDRCNLRCSYCMPEVGLNWLPRQDLLSYEEMFRLCRIFSELGIEKIRFTGGEPTLRKEFSDFSEKVKAEGWFRSMHLTTNATQRVATHTNTGHAIWESVNISLDTLDPQNFERITRRNVWPEVMQNIRRIQDAGIGVRINMVVMNGINDHEILDFADWAFREKIDVRFIEEMPFNGSSTVRPLIWNDAKIAELLRSRYDLQRVSDYAFGETAAMYHAPGMIGRIGIIAAYTRSFCGMCNRLRLTPQGELLTCLYSDNGVSLRDALRDGASDQRIKEIIIEAVSKKEKDGHSAEAARSKSIEDSMAIIGG
jgi:molybdenum cofactor biosynthesis protein A